MHIFNMFIRLEGNIDVCLAWRRAIKVGSVTIIMVVPRKYTYPLYAACFRAILLTSVSILVQNSVQICVEKRDGQTAGIKEFDL